MAGDACGACLPKQCTKGGKTGRLFLRPPDGRAARLIRQMARPDAAEVIILAMTANVFKEDVRRVAAAGMNGHSGKPVDYTTMRQQMCRAFCRKGRRDR